MFKSVIELIYYYPSKIITSYILTKDIGSIANCKRTVLPIYSIQYFMKVLIS